MPKWSDQFPGGSNDSASGPNFYEGLSGNSKISGGDDGDNLIGDPVENRPDGGGDDNITGGSGDDHILGRSGHDVINASGGNDCVNPGTGWDDVNVAGGDDVIIHYHSDVASTGNQGNLKNDLADVPKSGPHPDFDYYHESGGTKNSGAADTLILVLTEGEQAVIIAEYGSIEAFEAFYETMSSTGPEVNFLTDLSIESLGIRIITKGIENLKIVENDFAAIQQFVADYQAGETDLAEGLNIDEDCFDLPNPPDDMGEELSDGVEEGCIQEDFAGGSLVPSLLNNTSSVDFPDVDTLPEKIAEFDVTDITDVVFQGNGMDSIAGSALDPDLANFVELTLDTSGIDNMGATDFFVLNAFEAGNMLVASITFTINFDTGRVVTSGDSFSSIFNALDEGQEIALLQFDYLVEDSRGIQSIEPQTAIVDICGEDDPPEDKGEELSDGVERGCIQEDFAGGSLVPSLLNNTSSVDFPDVDTLPEKIAEFDVTDITDVVFQGNGMDSIAGSALDPDLANFVELTLDTSGIDNMGATDFFVLNAFEAGNMLVASITFTINFDTGRVVTSGDSFSSIFNALDEGQEIALLQFDYLVEDSRGIQSIEPQTAIVDICGANDCPTIDPMFMPEPINEDFEGMIHGNLLTEGNAIDPDGDDIDIVSVRGFVDIDDGMADGIITVTDQWGTLEVDVESGGYWFDLDEIFASDNLDEGDLQNLDYDFVITDNNEDPDNPGYDCAVESLLRIKVEGDIDLLPVECEIFPLHLLLREDNLANEGVQAFVDKWGIKNVADNFSHDTRDVLLVRDLGEGINGKDVLDGLYTFFDPNPALDESPNSPNQAIFKDLGSNDIQHPDHTATGARTDYVDADSSDPSNQVQGDNAIGGADRINTGADNDIIFARGGADHVDGDACADFIHGGSSGLITGSDSEYSIRDTSLKSNELRAIDAKYADILQGDAHADLIMGGDGRDIITGEGNGPQDQGLSDILLGGAGDDDIRGGGGGDIIAGGTGDDHLWGGSGHSDSGEDLFVFDLITTSNNDLVNGNGSTVIGLVGNDDDDTIFDFSLMPHQDALGFIGSDAFGNIGNFAAALDAATTVTNVLGSKGTSDHILIEFDQNDNDGDSITLENTNTSDLGVSTGTFFQDLAGVGALEYVDANTPVDIVS